MSSPTATAQDGWLSREARRRLDQHLGEALRRARSRGEPVLASVTEPCAASVDPAAVVLATRRRGEPWFCLEQPERGRFALAALGCAAELRAAGASRFTELAAQWRRAAAAATHDPGGTPGSGLVALGGLAFAADDATSPSWSDFGGGSLVVPELSLARRHETTWLTVTVAASPDATVADLQARGQERLHELRQAPLPLLDPAPTGRYTVRSVMPPSHYEEAVARAVGRIRRGELEKVVLAREVEVTAPTEHDPAAIFGVLREAFPACFVFAVGRGDATFLGASPELLVRREGARASTVALAGSARRSADPAVDDHLGEGLLRSDKDREENAIVARRIARVLRPHAVWVTVAGEPALVRVANIQHLASPIRAQLARPLGAIELAGLLHPTPAVGGEPWTVAEPLIPALEGFHRGWYAGPIGWTDATGDGELCVALRCGLLRRHSARLFAGAGIVRDSDPAAELAETEVKLQALLPVVSG